MIKRYLDNDEEEKEEKKKEEEKSNKEDFLMRFNMIFIFYN